MEDDTHTTTQPSVPFASSAAAVPADAADDARAQRLARRSQLRDEAERDAPEQQRRRLESLAAKAAAREAHRAAALAAQAALWRSFGPAQKLFADGVASCLSFLSLADFNSAAQTCKSWTAGAQRVPSLGAVDVVHALRDDLLRPMLASPFHHLISSLTDWVPCSCRHCRGFIQEFPCFQWTRPRLSLMRQLSGLTSIRLCMDVTRIKGSRPVPFPARLRKVYLALGCVNSGEAEFVFDCSALLVGLSACASLRRLELQFLDPNPIDLSALSQLTQLRHFRLSYLATAVLTPALLGCIKQLPLESLSFWYCNDDEATMDDLWDQSWMRELLAAPHQLTHLTQLDVDPFNWFNDDLPLSSLPALTTLTPQWISPHVLPQLASFPNLTCLHLTLEGNDGLDAAMYDEHLRVRAAAVLPHLRPLTALTELHMDGVAFTKADFAALCNAHHGLQVLKLYVAVASLEGLGTLTSLRELTLSLAKHAEVADVAEHVGQCKSLEKLKLDQMSPALSDAHQLALKPPSALLPRLKSFDYTAR